MYIPPCPISTPATDKPFSEPWKMWFRDVSSNLTDMTKTTITSGMTYSVHGNIVYFEYNGPNVRIKLPYPVNVKTICELYFDNSYPVVERIAYKLEKDALYVDLSEYTEYVGNIGLKGFYFINLNRPDQYKS